MRQRSLQNGRQRFSGRKDAGPRQRGQLTVRGEGMGSGTEAQLHRHIGVRRQAHTPFGVLAHQPNRNHQAMPADLWDEPKGRVNVKAQ